MTASSGVLSQRGERAITIYYNTTEGWVHTLESEVKETGGPFLTISSVVNTMMECDTIHDYIKGATQRVKATHVRAFRLEEIEFVCEVSS